MTAVAQLVVSSRNGAGTGPAREVRRHGLVPAILYGDDKEPTLLAIEERVLVKEMRHPDFFSTLYEVEIAGKKQKTLIRDVQLHPVNDRPLHVDFMRVSEKSHISVAVPLVFLNEEKSPGLKKGGILNVLHYTVEVICSATNILHQLEVDLKSADIGYTLHQHDIKLPQGMKFASSRDEALASIIAPKTKEEAEPAPVAAAAAPAAAPAKGGKE